MRTRLFFLLSVGALISSYAFAAPGIGQRCSFKLVDVDGKTLSSADRIVTVLVLTSRHDADKAQLVGNRIPDRCLGVSTSRMITVVRFQPTQNRTVRAFLTSVIRHRLDSEATHLKARYLAKHVTRDARQDIHAVADFDGQTATQLGMDTDISRFRVLVVAADGSLLRDWTDVPGAQDLSAALP